MEGDKGPIGSDDVGRKAKKQRKQYDRIPSSRLEEYEYLLSSFEEGDARPECPQGHKLFRYIPFTVIDGAEVKSDIEEFYDTSFTCSACRERRYGGLCGDTRGCEKSPGRWSCVVCHDHDTCFQCRPCSGRSAALTNEVGAISFARRHLHAASLAEQDGIPVGALLVPRQFAGDIRRDWSEAGLPSPAEAAAAGTIRPSVGPLGKIGFKKVQEVPGDARYFVLVLSTNSAQMVSAGLLPNVPAVPPQTGAGVDADDNDDNDDSEDVDLDAAAAVVGSKVLSSAEEVALVRSFLAAHRYAEYFPGVRLFDALLSRGTPSAAQYRNTRVSRSDNKKEFGFARVLPDGSPAHVARPSGGDRFRFAEIFAGIGGFRLGLDAAGGRCVFAAEINEDARHTYSVNFPDDESASRGVMHHDVTEHYAADMPAFDLLTAGFPCQSFSNRGEQKGLDDPRGQLYLELLRILRVRRPAAFLFENVARLVTIDGGRRNKPHEPKESCVVGATFALMLQHFAACGYGVCWRILNSRHWLPQMRERVYIVGVRSDLLRRHAAGGAGLADLFSWDAVLERSGNGLASTVRGILQRPEEFLAPATFRSAATGETLQYAPECVLSAAQWARVSSAEFEAKSNRYPGRCPKGQERLIDLEGKSPTLNSGYRNVGSFSTKYVGEERDGSVRELPRFLTPRECCRLQGFPESFEMPMANLAQCGRFYVQIGNAVCPPVIRSIGEEILLLLESLRFREEEVEENKA